MLTTRVRWMRREGRAPAARLPAPPAKRQGSQRWASQGTRGSKHAQDSLRQQSFPCRQSRDAKAAAAYYMAASGVAHPSIHAIVWGLLTLGRPPSSSSSLEVSSQYSRIARGVMQAALISPVPTRPAQPLTHSHSGRIIGCYVQVLGHHGSLTDSAKRPLLLFDRGHHGVQMGVGGGGPHLAGQRVAPPPRLHSAQSSPSANVPRRATAGGRSYPQRPHSPPALRPPTSRQLRPDDRSKFSAGARVVVLTSTGA